MTAVHDHAAARAALARVAVRTQGLFAGLTETEVMADTRWTVGDVGAHLLIALRGFTDAVSGDGERWAGLAPQVGSFHDRLAAFSARTIAEEPPRDLAALGAHVVQASEEFLAASAGCHPDERMPTPWYGDGASLSVSAATCLLLAEQVVHGYDIARQVGSLWPMRQDEACLVFHAVTAMMPMVVDVAAAKGVSASFDIRLRGGQRFVVRVDDGTALVEPPGPQPVDCHLSVDPVAFLLVGYGRVSQWRAIARGQLMTWGRRPWWGLRLKGLFSNP
ncbi:MAG: maleylpyruvate isomerase N-terminal domain-containing protein [Egibacteraceae bacterium]